MSRRTGERVPGDTLRQLIEEHDQIQEFKRFVRERCGLLVQIPQIITNAVAHRVNLEREQRVKSQLLTRTRDLTFCQSRESGKASEDPEP